MIRTQRLLTVFLIVWTVPALVEARQATLEIQPVPDEMAQMSFLQGDWRATPSFINFSDETLPWIETAPFETRYESRYGGSFILGDMDVLFPGGQSSWQSFLIVSYDQFRDRYRITVHDNNWALSDVLEGNWRDGAIYATNSETGTWGPGGMNGEMIPATLRIIPDPDADAWTFEWLSTIGGVEERPVIRVRHERIEEGEGAPGSDPT